MGFWSDAWDAAKTIGKGVVDVFVGITAVLILTIYAIGYAIFSIFEHLYDWIDKMVDKVGSKLKGTTMVPPTETEEFIKGLRDKGKTTLPPYKPGVKRSLLVAHDSNGKVVAAQVASTEKGFDSTINEAFKKGHLVEQPVEA
ncbi:MAG: hypothetical protein Q4D36_06435 [Bacteroidales bacterium]|nr:hypothetical protein [Bacteroidales bacterium]